MKQTVDYIKTLSPKGLKFQADRMVKEFRTEFKNQGEPSYRAPWYKAVRWDRGSGKSKTKEG